jgi:hypothetical protein
MVICSSGYHLISLVYKRLCHTGGILLYLRLVDLYSGCNAS